MNLCATVATLGLDVERCAATWPLDGCGTKHNIVSREDMAESCK